MSGVINLLAAEIPNIDLKTAVEDLLRLAVLHAYRARELIADHIDALGGGFAFPKLIVWIFDFASKRSFARSRLAEDNELGFAKIIDACFLALPPIVADSVQ